MAGRSPAEEPEMDESGAFASGVDGNPGPAADGECPAVFPSVEGGSARDASLCEERGSAQLVQAIQWRVIISIHGRSGS